MQESLTVDAPERWYALKVVYNRTSPVGERIAADGRRSYVPMHRVERAVGGRTVSREEPLVGSLMFVRAEERYVVDLERRLTGKVMLYRRSGGREPAPIPDTEMEIFMLVTSIRDRGLEPVDAFGADCRRGDRVRVTDGVFKGAEGYVRRIGKDRRLVVSIEGVVAVATSYIPLRFLQRID